MKSIFEIAINERGFWKFTKSFHIVSCLVWAHFSHGIANKYWGKFEAHLFNDECLLCSIVNNRVNHMQNITMIII